MADAVSRLTHLPERQFIYHLHTHFPYSKPWSLLPIPSGCKQQLTTMLHNNQSPRGYLQPFSIKTPPSGANGSASAAGCKSPPTSKTLRNPFPSSKFSPITSLLAFYLCKGNLSRSNLSINTSNQSVKYLHLWGPTTPDTTAWGSFTLDWDSSWCPIRRRILLQQYCIPSLSALSKPWTPSPRETPQETLPSAISTQSPSSSSSGQANNTRAVPTLSSAPSVSGTYNSSLDSSLTTPQRRPMP